MSSHVQVDLWQREKSAPLRTSALWTLWPLVLLGLYQPSLKVALTAVPLIGLACLRSRNVAWAAKPVPFWLAVVVLTVTLKGAGTTDFAKMVVHPGLVYLARHSFVFAATIIAGSALAGMLMAAAGRGGNEEGYGYSDIARSRVRARPVGIARIRARPVSPLTQASRAFSAEYSHLKPRMDALAIREREALAYFQDLSNQCCALLKQGDRAGADQIKPECDKALQAFKAIHQELCDCHAQLKPFQEQMELARSRPETPHG